jgi:hypothetical protein
MEQRGGMTAAALPTGEPVALPSPATGSVFLPGLDDALALARAWAGESASMKIPCDGQDFHG